MFIRLSSSLNGRRRRSTSTGVIGVIATAGGAMAIATAATGKPQVRRPGGAVFLSRGRLGSDSAKPSRGRINAPGWALKGCNSLETLRAVSSSVARLRAPGGPDLQYSSRHGSRADPSRHLSSQSGSFSQRALGQRH